MRRIGTRMLLDPTVPATSTAKTPDLQGAIAGGVINRLNMTTWFTPTIYQFFISTVLANLHGFINWNAAIFWAIYSLSFQLIFFRFTPVMFRTSTRLRYFHRKRRCAESQKKCQRQHQTDVFLYFVIHVYLFSFASGPFPSRLRPFHNRPKFWKW